MTSKKSSGLLVRATSCCILLLLLSSPFAQAEMRCKMRYDVRAYQAWYDFGSNMIYGLYAKTPEDEEEGCPRCDAFGNKVAELHYTVVALEDNRRFWLNKNNILGPGFFESLVRTFEVFYLFENFFKQTIVLF